MTIEYIADDMESGIYKMRNLATVVMLAALLIGLAGCFGDEDPPTTGDDAGVDATNTVPSDTGDAISDDADRRREVGESCFGPQDCVDGASCIGTGGEDQYICMSNCSEPGRICEDGSVCTPRLNPADPICFTGGDTATGERCQTNLDCEPGTLCFGSDSDHYCLPACHELDPGVCPDGTSCELLSSSGKGLCRSRVGATCDTGTDCAEALSCSEELGGEFSGLLPGGYCTQSGCASDSECPENSRCRTFPGTSTPVCVATCASDGDCRFNQDYRCLRDGYCDDVGNPEGCEDFRVGEDICFPVALSSNF